MTERPLDDVAEQTQRLTRARKALLGGRPRAALTQLDAHARDYPKTPLDDLRGALRVEVLCALGKPTQARGEARLLVDRHPDSNVARRAATLCPADGPAPFPSRSGRAP